MLDKQHADAQVINTSGRQRMLSQRIAKYAILASQKPETSTLSASSISPAAARDSLLSAFTEWQNAHLRLKQTALQGANYQALSANQIALFDTIEPYYQQMVVKVQAITQPAPSVDNPKLDSDFSTAENRYLFWMNRITLEYTQEAQNNTSFIIRLEWLLLVVTFLILAAEAVWIFWPLEKKAKDFVDQEAANQDQLRQNNAQLQHLLEEQERISLDLTQSRQDAVKSLTDSERLSDELEESNRQLQRAFLAARLGGFTYHWAERRLVLRQEATELFGERFLTLDEKGLPTLDFKSLAGDSYQPVLQFLIDNQHNQEPYTIKSTIIGPKGDLMNLRIFAQTIFDAEGKPIGVEGAFQDITEQVKKNIQLEELNDELAEKIDQLERSAYALIQNEESLKRALRETNSLKNDLEEKSAFLAMAQELTSLYSYEVILAEKKLVFGPSTAVLFGLPLDADPNQTDWSQIVCVPINSFEEAIKYTVHTKKPYRAEFPIRRASDGALRYIRNTGRPIIDHKGWVLKIVGALQDVTEEVLNRHELEKARAIAQQAADAKTMFLSTMSHEIRTPMNAVIGFAQLLSIENKQPELEEHVNTLQYSANHLLSLINDILDYNKIESGKLEFESVPFDLHNLSESVLKMFALRAEENELALRLEEPVRLQRMLLGDTVRLNQILTNLLGNAIKFTDKGEVSLSYTIEEDLGHEVRVRFTVTDTGIGIPEEKLDTIFDSFTQVNKEITRQYGGTGLGLAICKRLVVLQGGRIWATSQPGKGSVFHFTLPFGLGEGIDQLVLPIAKEDYPEQLSLKGYHILVVEDNSINQLVIRKFLSKWGADFELAANGLLGVEAAKTGRFDLVLMDLQMPVMDGYTATAAIRELGPPYDKLPIIALTASASIEVKEQVLKKGLNDYISKPFVANDLFQTIRKHLVRTRQTG